MTSGEVTMLNASKQSIVSTDCLSHVEALSQTGALSQQVSKLLKKEGRSDCDSSTLAIVS